MATTTTRDVSDRRPNHIPAIIDLDAERCRRREGLRRLATRLDAARARLGLPPHDPEPTGPSAA